jgi:hypothetical protein
MSIPFQFSVKQVARLRGCDPHTVYSDLKRGMLLPVSWARTPLMVSRQEVERSLGRRLTEADAIRAFSKNVETAS